MFNTNQAGRPPPSPPNLTRGVATVGGIVAAFFGTPVVYRSTKIWLTTFTAEHYGTAWTDIAACAWFVLLGCACFFGARVALSDLIQAGRAFFGGRFF